MSYRVLYFTGPGQVELRPEALPDPAADQVLVASEVSAISPGTEMLVYRGQFPADLAVDESIGALGGEFGYPLRYGYAVVGRVIACGARVEPAWVGQWVFAFQPHATHFLARPEDLIPLPAQMGLEDAVFLPNIETAVNFLLDGAPLVGERVVVLGQGIVGLLTTALLARFPLKNLLVSDRYPERRAMARRLGAHISLDPQQMAAFKSYLPQGADLTYELTGVPEALNQAIAVTGFNGRIVIGSWYGTKPAALNLGGRFHRNRQHLVSSQVSTLNPVLSGRWTKDRRLEVAWDLAAELHPASLITHRIPFSDAGEAYRLIDQQPENTIQVVLTYS